MRKKQSAVGQIPTFDDIDNIFYAKTGGYDLPKLAYQMEHDIKDFCGFILRINTTPIQIEGHRLNILFNLTNLFLWWTNKNSLVLRESLFAIGIINELHHTTH